MTTNKLEDKLQKDLFEAVKNVLEKYKEKDVRIFIFLVLEEQFAFLTNSCIACAFEDLAKWYLEHQPEHLEPSSEKVH